MAMKKIERAPYPRPQNKMNVWGFCPTYSNWFTNAWEHIKFIPTAIKFTYQRAKYGVCDWDTYDLRDTLDDYFVNLLYSFRERTRSFPDTDFETFEDWIAFIDSLINELLYLRADDDLLNEYHPAYLAIADKNTSEWTDDERISYNEYLRRVQAIWEEKNRRRTKLYTKIGEYNRHFWW
jgi:hypothetical protein